MMIYKVNRFILFDHTHPAFFFQDQMAPEDNLFSYVSRFPFMIIDSMG